MLESGYFENETWGALHKCWKGYIIALNHYEIDKMIEYATRIQRLQHDLGLEISQFPNLSIPKFEAPNDSTRYLNDNYSEEEVDGY